MQPQPRGLSTYLRHNPGCELARPVERVCWRIPFQDKGHGALCQMIQIREVTDAPALSLQDAEPLLDLGHKGGNATSKRWQMKRG